MGPHVVPMPACSYPVCCCCPCSLLRTASRAPSMLLPTRLAVCLQAQGIGQQLQGALHGQHPVGWAAEF